MYDTTGLVVGVPDRDDFDPADLEGLRSPAVAADEWGGWVWINLAGPDAAPPLIEAIGPEISADLGRFRMEDMILHEVLEWDVPVNYKAIVDGFNEIYHTKQLHHVDASWTKASRNTSFHIVGDNYMCFVPRADNLDKLTEDPDHHRYAICHYVVFPNTVFNCNPEHVQVFNPIPIDVDRTRFLCWQLIYPGDLDDPEYADYYARTMRHWEVLKGVVAEDIEIYDQLARTKRSSGYTQAHPERPRVQARPLPREHEPQDRRLTRSRRPGSRGTSLVPGDPGGGTGRRSEFGDGLDLDEELRFEQRLHAVERRRHVGHRVAEHLADAREERVGHARLVADDEDRHLGDVVPGGAAASSAVPTLRSAWAVCDARSAPTTTPSGPTPVWPAT